MTFIPQKTSQSGFTLIEIMVSVSIFALIMTVGIGALLTVNQAHRLSQAKRAAVDNVNYVMEMMSREIRTGYDYSPSSSASFNFTDQDGVPITYTFTTNGVLLKTTGLTGQPAQVTDLDTVVITGIAFDVVGEVSADTIQPYVTITMSFHPASAPTQQVQGNDSVVQTSISQRLLDVGATSASLTP